MINLDKFTLEINQIKDQYRRDEENELSIHRTRLLEILGDFFGVEWDSQGEMAIKNNNLEMEEMNNFLPFYEEVNEIGIKDVSFITKKELERDIEELIDIFYRLQEESLFEIEEESVSDEEIINDEEEVL